MLICISTETTDPGTNAASKFLDEALRMHEFDHPNILRLIGISLDNNSLPLVVLPFMKHGDLLSYIRNDNNVGVTANRKITDDCYAYQFCYF